ncbi:MAG TPA: glycosyltransferase [Phaeodactylibacter sp.]|nr:glycosyltransferase [Phaeodactylibacter sp.]
MPEIVLTATSDLTGDQRMQRIAAALSDMGHGVLLLGRVLPDSQPLSNRAYRQKRLKCFFHKGKLFYLEFQLRLFFFLLFRYYDLAWAADLDTVLPHWLLKKLRGKPWIYDAHEYFTEVPELQGRAFSKRIWELVARLCIPDCCSAVTVGETLAEVLANRYGRPFCVLRNVPAVDWSGEGGGEKPYSFVRKVIPKKPVLLYQGALNAGRGLPELLQAVKALPGVELWLAGRGDLSVALRQMVEEEGLNERVRFFGHLPPERLSDLTKAATLGLDLLDASSLNYYYSLSNKSMDYLQAALPSIEMDFPEYRRLHEQWGVYVLLPDLEVRHIVEAIRSLLADERRYTELSEKAARAASALNWEREQEVLQDVLKNCMTHV